MKSSNILIGYGLFISLVLTLIGVFTAKNVQQLLSSFLYLPLLFYFASRLIKLFKHPSKKPHRKKIVPVYLPTPEKPEIIKDVADNDRRIFLKLIGSAGMSMLLMALFTKKAQAAFFGSAPTGPGIVAIKNSAGTPIDPAESHPTDGYEITELDDSSSPAYYGFLKKTGAWYIMKEDSTGAYRYSKGASDFSTNWEDRENLEYNYFDSVFG